MMFNWQILRTTLSREFCVARQRWTYEVVLTNLTHLEGNEEGSYSPGHLMLQLL